MTISDAAPLRIAQPLPVYAIDINTIEQRDLLSRARLTGWQYPIVDNNSVQATAEVSQTNEALTYSALHHGDHYTENLASAIMVAERVAGQSTTDFELRLLRAPAVYLTAVWLHANDADLLIPVAPAPADLEISHEYTETELADALLQLALQRRSISDSEA